MSSYARRALSHRLSLVLFSCALGCASEPDRREPESSVAPWRLLGAIPELRYSMDTSRIEAIDDYHSVWLRFDYSAEQVTTGGLRFRVILLRQEVNCATRVTRSREMTALDSLGAPVPGFEFPSTGWVPFEQHPMTAVYPDAACGAMRLWGYRGPA